jgi:hypothetical protein
MILYQTKIKNPEKLILNHLFQLDYIISNSNNNNNISNNKPVEYILLRSAN